MANVDAAKAQDYITVYDHIQTLEKQVKKAKEKLAEIEKELLPQFKDSGMDKGTFNGVTVWLDRKIWASSGGNVPGMIEALQSAGVDELVSETVNATRLTSWVREHDPDNALDPDSIRQKLPPEVQEVINISEKFQLRVTRSK